MKTVLQPKRIRDMAWRKPHYTKHAKQKVINPSVRQLFMPKKAVHMSSLESLMGSLYVSCSESSVFQYAVPSAKPSYEPHDIINVIEEIEVTTTSMIPPTIPQIVEQLEHVKDPLPKYTEAQVILLEENTREQCESCLWKDHHVGRITSSVAHRVLSKARKLKNETEVGNTENLIRSILGKESPDPNLPALKYGRTVEPVAQQNYEFVMRGKGHKKLNVKKCGMFVDKTLIFMGSSPDGIVTCECCGSGALEIKCPLSIAHEDPRVTPPPYLTRSKGTLSLKENHQYMTQISMHLSNTGLKWCDFFVYTSKGHFLQRISTESVNKLILELREASEVVFYKYRIYCNKRPGAMHFSKGGGDYYR